MLPQPNIHFCIFYIQKCMFGWGNNIPPPSSQTPLHLGRGQKAPLICIPPTSLKIEAGNPPGQVYILYTCPTRPNQKLRRGIPRGRYISYIPAPLAPIKNWGEESPGGGIYLIYLPPTTNEKYLNSENQRPRRINKK